MKWIATVSLALLVPAFLLAADEPTQEPVKEKPKHHEHEAMEGGTQKAVAVIHGIGKNKVMGKVVFTQEGSSVKITGEITGLKPGEHAFHVHEFGDCSSPDGMSAGGHFNPAHMPHGGPHAAKRHAGDLGNITADEEGKVTLDLTDKEIKLTGHHSIIGRSLVIHADPDDLKSQPAGNAGARVGCGVIGIAKPAAEKPVEAKPPDEAKPTDVKPEESK